MSNHLGTFNIIVIYLPLLALLRCISRHAYHPTQYHSASDKAYVSHSCFRPLVPPLCGGQCLAHFWHTSYTTGFSVTRERKMLICFQWI